MKRLIVAAATVLALSACGNEVGNIGGPDTGGVEVTVPDGRVVPCVIYDSGTNAGGLSCDWSGAH